MGIILRQVEPVLLAGLQVNFDKTTQSGGVPDTSSRWTPHPGESHCKSQSEMAWAGPGGGVGGKKIREAVKHTLMQTTSFLKRAPGELQGQPALNQHQLTQPRVYSPWEDGWASLTLMH